MTRVVTFGKLGDGYPVPDLVTDAIEPNEFDRAVAEHAIPYLRPVLTEMGHPEYAECFFRTNREETGGEFWWLDLVAGKGARFCATRISETVAE